LSKLRKHQQQFEDILDRIITGEDINQIYIHATPGAGKSTIPIQATSLIRSGYSDRIAWIVPRLTLGYQAESNFLDPFFRKMFESKCCIRSSTNEFNPCRGTRGFVTTYQALGVDDKKTVLQEFTEHRYILVLDEFHHCELDGVWHKALQPIIDKAKYVIYMTGTLSRGDDKRIAWTPYVLTGRNTYEPDFTDHELIRYTRTDALEEKAILPLKFFLSDGIIEYENNKGQVIKGKLSKQYKDTGDAIYTALETKFAEDLLAKGITHWQNYRLNHPRSKCVVVCADIAHAKKIGDMLTKMGCKSKIATSDDDKAIEIIKEFKFGSLNLLVSVAMIYEGFDSRPLTHVILLTRFRSVSWIEQVIARAVRIDPEAGPYHTQQGFIFAPDDPLFRSVVDIIKHEQIQSAKSTDPAEGRSGSEGNGGGGRKADITPLNGEISGSREVYLGQIPTGYQDIIPQTISEKEGELRTKIAKHVNKFCYDNRYKEQKINKEILESQGKARDLMELSELDACLKYVRDCYPLSGMKIERQGVSKSRGKRQRVPIKAIPWIGELFKSM
jgi:superfamily II DNA or RNA helicase